MTVSAGAGGGSVVGVVIGTSAGGGAVTVVNQLPFTGASHLMLLLALAFFMLVAGYFLTGLGRRRHELGPVGDHRPLG